MKPGIQWNRLSFALLAFSTLLGIGDAHGQTWAINAAAGRIVHEGLGDRIGTAGTSLGIRYDGPQWLYLSGGVPFDSAGVLWSAIGAGGRLGVGGRAGLGVDLGAHLYGFRERTLQGTGQGATLEAMPLLAVSSDAVRLEVRSGIRYYASAFSGESESRRVHQSDVRLAFAEPVFRITGESRLLRAEEGSFPFLGADAEVDLGSATLWGSAGKWLSDEIQTAVWSTGAIVRIGTMGDVFASLQQETNDPLYWQTPRRSWNVGVSRRLGGGPVSIASNVLPPLIRGELVTFRLPAAVSTEAPFLGGDFTRWEAVSMTREAEFWIVTLPVPSGVHRYAFRHSNGEWFVPESIPDRVEDGFGGYSATLIVP